MRQTKKGGMFKIQLFILIRC